MAQKPLITGLQNPFEKRMRLAMTCGPRVFASSNMAVAEAFAPVLVELSIRERIGARPSELAYTLEAT